MIEQPSNPFAKISMGFVRCPDYVDGVLHEPHEHEVFDKDGVSIAKGRCIGLTVGVDHIRYVTGGDPICREPGIDEPTYNISIEAEIGVMCYKCANRAQMWIYGPSAPEPEGNEE